MRSLVSWIKVDHDGRGISRKEFRNRLLSFLRIYRVPWVEVEERTTARGKHLYLAIGKGLSPEEIILVQLALGSDARREIFNFERIMQGVPIDEANVLFTRKMRGSSVVSREKFLCRYTVYLDPECPDATEEFKKKRRRKTPCQD